MPIFILQRDNALVRHAPNLVSAALQPRRFVAGNDLKKLARPIIAGITQLFPGEVHRFDAGECNPFAAQCALGFQSFLNIGVEEGPGFPPRSIERGAHPILGRQFQPLARCRLAKVGPGADHPIAQHVERLREMTGPRQ